MRTRIGYAHPDRLLSYPDIHYLSGCVLVPAHLTIDHRIEALPIRMRVDPLCRSAHERRDEAHDPRQSWSDTSPPISQAVPGLQSGSDDTHFVLPSSRQTKPGTKLSPQSVCTQNGKNSPCTRKTAQIPRFWTSRGNFVTDITRGS